MLELVLGIAVCGELLRVIKLFFTVAIVVPGAGHRVWIQDFPIFRVRIFRILDRWSGTGGS